MGGIVVVGSIHMDFICYIRKLPLPGETLQSYKTEIKPGGKGANQAVAAALSGGKVTLVGAVGNDLYSRDIVSGIKNHQVNIDRILRKDNDTGMAFIAVDESGQNSIVLSEGANGCLTVEDLKGLPELFEPSSVLLVQNEIPWACTRFALQAAKQRGIVTYVNPTPALVIDEDVFPLIDVMILNESEADCLTKVPVRLDKDLINIQQAASQIIALGVKEVIITLGEKGSYYMNNQEEAIFTPAYSVHAVDTTAAGDTFIGSFIVARQQGLGVGDALQQASAASAIAVSRTGAQESIPSADEIADFLSEYNKQKPV
ncbi:ribokinase [Paenibacillus sp. WQ 127069]|uniref:Ribokinase n=1 Tax=Paenibacillus baimaensis TaxID=2982185 RepID=A0ABT2UIT7_9BACL|nr:ribokinase [Paenibacillus sp. WQ 127069]MCU6794555.1 ribokinase [Paenibacillus sp. WQ 127069]